LKATGDRIVNRTVRWIDAVVREEDGRRAVAVKLLMGAQCGIAPVRFRESFARTARNTLAEGARLEIETLADLSNPLVHEVVIKKLEIERAARDDGGSG
jgi:hypothetical protein